MIGKRRFYTGPDLAHAHAIGDLRARAQKMLPRVALEYIEGGAEDEVTLAANRAVFSEIFFRPNVLVAGSRIDTTTTLFGKTLPLPIVIAPTGSNGLFWPQGDLCLARAAAAFGIPFTQSSVSNVALEEAAAVPGLRHWMQLYVFRQREMMDALVARALDAGSEALVFTVDASIYGNREWDRRNYRAPMDPTFRNKLDALRRWRWTRHVLAPGLPAFANVAHMVEPNMRTYRGTAAWSQSAIDPDLTWDHVAHLRKIWPRRLIVKGIATVGDAQRAADLGADAIVLSNHGGRQLDGAIPPLAALPAVAAKLKGQIAILVDSGFRRGTDIVKALALGADAILLGRATLYGLAAAGEPGVARALTILRDETVRAIALLGRESVRELSAEALAIRRDGLMASVDSGALNGLASTIG